MSDRYFEDFAVGQVHKPSGRIRVEKHEIIDFATKYDPQPFHLDDEAGRKSIFGRLVASGWHTASLFMRLLVDGHLKHVDSIASPGVDEIRWLKPVRPGDTLRGRLTILEAIPSKSGARRGTMKTLGELFNHRGELVMTLRAISIVGARPQGGERA